MGFSAGNRDVFQRQLAAVNIAERQRQKRVVESTTNLVRLSNKRLSVRGRLSSLAAAKRNEMADFLSQVDPVELERAIADLNAGVRRGQCLHCPNGVVRGVTDGRPLDHCNDCLAPYPGY